ncbi:hypothetical protein LXA43DRAFT_941956 [Ganoderma leucocontextum]|nr:hypothetical protein LXA43DRAFT_941956 [Ganoderma leucocontextum]
MAHSDLDFDLEELVNVEQTFYEHGYRDGFAHGRVHGLIEGRALGREKGFEMWEELGFYEGFARMWGALLLQAQGAGAAAGTTDERAQNHIRHLLELVARFPRVNPSAGPDTDPERDVDIPRLFRQIRSRYKLLCATLGVRPSLRAADEASPSRSPDRQPGLGHDDLGGGTDMDMDMDGNMARTPSATGRVATRTERKKVAVWAVRDPRADRTPGGGGGGGGGAELSF